MKYIYGMLAVLIVSILGVSLAIANTSGMGHMNYNEESNTQEEYAHTTGNYMDNNHYDSHPEEYPHRTRHNPVNHHGMGHCW